MGHHLPDGHGAVAQNDARQVVFGKHDGCYLTCRVQACERLLRERRGRLVLRRSVLEGIVEVDVHVPGQWRRRPHGARHA